MTDEQVDTKKWPAAHLRSSGVLTSKCLYRCGVRFFAVFVPGIDKRKSAGVIRRRKSDWCPSEDAAWASAAEQIRNSSK